MTYSKIRQQAEAAFDQVQSQFFARDHAVEELDYVAQEREAKTLRLREARLAREECDRNAALAVALAKRPKQKQV
ncbi:hypothetical protein [Neorhizobium sp. LjRoot104]|uniref:hypothetical protein n=1 Tax=Neorhizobium sp. LjRoot104 TaxID=3342254 RepID=UPI003ECE2785